MDISGESNSNYSNSVDDFDGNVEQDYSAKEKMALFGGDMSGSENFASGEDISILKESQALKEVGRSSFVALVNASTMEDHEALVSMQIGDMVPEVGMVFHSEDQAYNFYNAYARKQGFSVRKNHLGRRKDGTTRDRHFVCNKEGMRIGDKRRTPRKPRAIERTNCMARIEFKVERGDVWIVRKVVLEHNHPLATPNEVHFLKSQRRKLHVHHGLINQTDNAGIRHTQVLSNYTREEVSGVDNDWLLHLDHNYYLGTKRMRSLKKGDVQVLLDYLKSRQSKDPSFFYAIQVDEEEKVSNFFWADSRSIMDYAYFGDVVSFDTSYRINNYDMPFAPFIGVNHHQQIVIFGVALLLDETIESFMWLFQTWMVAMSGRQPKTIFTDHCSAMSSAISLVLPNTCHRLCLWHIFQNAAKHLSHVYNSKPNFQKEFKSCIYESGSEEDFRLRWDELLGTHGLAGNPWLEDMYEVRENWAPIYCQNTFSASMTTTKWSKSINNFFRKWLNRKLPLLELVVQYEKALVQYREKELLEDFKSKQTEPILWAELPLLKQAAGSYTRKMFEEFEEEFKCYLGCCIEIGAIDGTMYTFKVVNSTKHSLGLVQFDSSNDSVTCSCKKFESMGILCMHILKVLNHRNILHLPSQYILKRWMKDAKHGEVFNGQRAGLHTDGRESLTLQYTRVYNKAVTVAVKSSHSKEALEMIESELDKLMEEVEALSRNVATDK